MKKHSSIFSAQGLKRILGVFLHNINRNMEKQLVKLLNQSLAGI